MTVEKPMPVDPSPIAAGDTAAEVVADHLAVTLGMCGDGTDATSMELGSLSIDALLAHAPESPDGVRRVVLEGRSGQDARIRGLVKMGVYCLDCGNEPANCACKGGDPSNDHPLYRLTDPSPEEA